MLTKMQAGWARLSIGQWNDRCSYLDDIPMNLLKALIHVCKTNSPAVVEFDAEGWEDIIVFDCLDTYILTDKSGETQLISLNTNIHKLAQELAQDIRDNLNAWVWWPCWFESNDEREIPKRTEELLKLCADLEAAAEE